MAGVGYVSSMAVRGGGTVHTDTLRKLETEGKEIDAEGQAIKIWNFKKQDVLIGSGFKCSEHGLWWGVLKTVKKIRV